MMSTRRKKKIKEENSELVAKVSGFDVCSEASINIDLRMDRPFLSRDTDLAHEFVTTLEIVGEFISPRSHIGELLELTIRGCEPHSGDFSTTLKDYQTRDKYRAPIYRTYRGEQIPVYEAPPGIALLNKVRGQNAWNAWLWLSARLVSDMLIVLNSKRDLYINIQELKKDRKRWIQSLSLQTSHELFNDR